jgi:hypothetical protein
MTSPSAAAQGLHARVSAELWTSFVALVRSYAAAGDLAKPPAKRTLVDVSDGRALTLRGERKALTLRFDDLTGQGEWMVNREGHGRGKALESGTFRFDEESRVVLGSRAEKLEMEVAAEEFTSKVFDEE